jgi:hypothetical protein
MPDRWMPGVVRRVSAHDGGSMVGGEPRIVWHTYEAPYAMTAVQGAQSLIRAGNEVHFVFDPVDGDLVQLLPANRAARGLRNAPGGAQTNRFGTACIQVEVIGYAAHPWTADMTVKGQRTLGRLVDFVRSWGVPDEWPAGPPPAYVNGVGNRPADPRSSRIWKHGGHFGHSQVPENDHGDPGAIDVRMITSGNEDDMQLSDQVTFGESARLMTGKDAASVEDVLDWTLGSAIDTNRDLVAVRAEVAEIRRDIAGIQDALAEIAENVAALTPPSPGR